MGSEELDMVGGGGRGPFQRVVDIGLTSLSSRSMQPDQYSRNTMAVPKRSEPPAKKQQQHQHQHHHQQQQPQQHHHRPGEGFGDYNDPGKFMGRDRQGFLQNVAERDYRETAAAAAAAAEGYHLDHRVQQQQKENCGESDERKNAYGEGVNQQLGGMGIGREQDQWGGERDGVGGEADFRDIGPLRGGGGGEVSEASQESEGSEEDEDDPVLEEGEEEGDNGAAGDRSRGGESVLEESDNNNNHNHNESRAGMPPHHHHPQMPSLESRMLGSRNMDGFQRPAQDRGGDSRVMKATSSSSPPFGIYLQTPGLPFINFQQAPPPPPGPHMGTHVEATSGQNGGVGSGLAAAGSGGYGGISRDSYAKSLAARECAMSSSMHEQQQQGQGQQLRESLQQSSEDNYYTSLLNSTASNNSSGQKSQDMGNEYGAGQKRSASRMMDSPSSAEPSLRRILSDPLTGQLMDDASIFGCGHSFGNAGLQRVIETNVCITCGASVRATSMAPNYALRAAVQAYKREEENSLPKLAKRRRDRPEDQGTPVEQQPSSDTSRSKGVQFPFSVSDRVLIKGNKRTPERFVGREAVITNQCLNGWYLGTFDYEGRLGLRTTSLPLSMPRIYFPAAYFLFLHCM
ncbi:hypothetical protein R1flu_024313 [Riccia fluitans]|uniref:PUB 62/63 C-terminal domain-containing protein n=1 Tax=Riccia fluitans TaxID=41844 RepID=A0ABD1XUJ0_9MARC